MYKLISKEKIDFDIKLSNQTQPNINLDITDKDNDILISQVIISDKKEVAEEGKIVEKTQQIHIYKDNNSITNTILAKRNRINAFKILNSPFQEKFSEVIANSLINLPYQLKKIEYKDIVDNPSEFYKNFVSKGHPCLIKNIVTDWPAYELWQDNNYLINKAENYEFTVDITPDGFADSIKGEYFVQPHQIKQTLSQFFNDLSNKANDDNKPIAYIQKQNNNLNEEFNILKTDIKPNVEEFFTGLFNKAPDASNIWIGSKESVTALHKDNYENIFVVVKGEKHFTLIPPVYYPFMEPCYYRDSKWEYNESSNEFVIKENEEDYRIPWISINPEIDSELLDAKATGINFKRYHAIIEAGDGLYLPPLWYHQVSQFSYTKDVIIGVNYWFDMEFNSNYVIWDLLRSLVDLK